MTTALGRSAVNLSTVSELVAQRKKGHMLPGDFYWRQDVFEIDMALMFQREWLYVGVAADVPEPGDCLTVEIGGSSVIITRGDDGKINAVHNVCRHRASRILPEGASSVAKLVCPYHQWTYDLDGKLLFVKNMGTEFKCAEHNLKPVNLRVVGGLIFICLADDAPSGMDELAQVMGDRLAMYDLENTKIAHEESIIEECNWKLTIENNRECYHCSVGHPELTISYPAAVLGCSLDEMTDDEREEWEAYKTKRDEMVKSWEARGFGSEYHGRTDGSADTYFSSERILIAGEGESATMDTRVACQKLLGDIKSKDVGDLNLWTHNAWFHFFCDHAVAITTEPLSPTRSRVSTKWLVHKDAAEGTDYTVENLSKVWHATNHQDSTFVARQQHGVMDPAYVPGPYSPGLETFVEKFVDWYLGRLGNAGY